MLFGGLFGTHACVLVYLIHSCLVVNQLKLLQERTQESYPLTFFSGYIRSISFYSRVYELLAPSFKWDSIKDNRQPKKYSVGQLLDENWWYKGNQSTCKSIMHISADNEWGVTHFVCISQDTSCMGG